MDSPFVADASDHTFEAWDVYLVAMGVHVGMVWKVMKARISNVHWMSTSIKERAPDIVSIN